MSNEIYFISCGWFASDDVKQKIMSTASKYSGRVKYIWLDGRIQRNLKLTWACGDIFVSLVDNIQETFGLTPLEAMAAGMPVIVSDWNGYRETVRDEVDGFLIPTSAPAPGFGERLARRFQSGDIDYEVYCGSTALTASVDLNQLKSAIYKLCVNKDMRRSMGGAGQVRAQTEFDWTQVFPRYLDLLRELQDIRKSFTGTIHPSQPPTRLDPFRLFEKYPTHLITANTKVIRQRKNGIDVLLEPMFEFASSTFLSMESSQRLLESTSETDSMTIQYCASSAKIDINSAVLAFCRFAKAGLVAFDHTN